MKRNALITRTSLIGLAAMLFVVLGTVAQAQDTQSEEAFFEGIKAYRAFEFDQAAQWFQRAAEAGDADAQFLLGRMHYDGNSLSVDNVTAYMWFDIAAENGLYAGARYREGISQRMSTDEIELAKQRSEAWRQMHATSPVR